MGWVSIYDPETGKEEILGDVDQYKKYNGIPHRNEKGEPVLQSELDEIDKAGE